LKIRRRREITVQTTQQFVISQAEPAVKAWCPACAAEVSMVTAEQAATLIGVNTRALYRLAESGVLHFVDTSEGRLLVCVKALSGMLET
jgi:hypothetical protein